MKSEVGLQIQFFFVLFFCLLATSHSNKIIAIITLMYYLFQIVISSQWIGKKDTNFFTFAHYCHRNSDSHTPLHIASQRGHNHVIQLLINGGAEVNPAIFGTDSNISPLHLAIKAGHVEVVKVLLANKADVAQKTPITALAAAIKYGHE